MPLTPTWSLQSRQDVRRSILRVRRSALLLHGDIIRGVAGFVYDAGKHFVVEIQGSDASVGQAALTDRRQRSHPRPRQCVQVRPWMRQPMIACGAILAAPPFSARA
jgi:hypothetical protein